MDTKERIATLKELQKIDRQLAHFRKMKEYEPRHLKDEEDKLAAQQARLKNLSERHAGKQREIGRKELEVKARDEKVKKFKGQLLTSDSNRTYQALMTEISLEEMEKRKVEDEILEMMVGNETFSSDENAIKADIEAAKKQVEAVRVEAKAALAEVAIQEGKLLKERREVAAKVDPDVLKTYEGLFKSRAGEAVVEAAYEAGSGGEEGQYQCKGCFMPLTHQMVNLLLIGKDIITCKSCGRILYVEDHGKS